MKRPSAGLWFLAGLTCAALGWIAGGLIGTVAGRTVLACGFTGAALGLLVRRYPLGGVAALACAATAGAGWALGPRLGSPLLAWPLAALVLGLAGAFLPQARLARIAAVVVTPFLGGLGFAAGAVGVVVVGLAANDARVMEQLLAGGAAGFGCASLGGLALIARWLDRRRAAEGSLP